MAQLTPTQLDVSMLSMARKVKLSEQVRKAVKRSELTKYRICKLADIDQPSMSRFMAGKVGLSMERLDRLAAVLDLRVVAGKSRQRKGR